MKSPQFAITDSIDVTDMTLASQAIRVDRLQELLPSDPAVISRVPLGRIAIFYNGPARRSKGPLPKIQMILEKLGNLLAVQFTSARSNVTSQHHEALIPQLLASGYLVWLLLGVAHGLLGYLSMNG